MGREQSNRRGYFLFHTRRIEACYGSSWVNTQIGYISIFRTIKTIKNPALVSSAPACRTDRLTGIVLALKGLKHIA
jgi:hypothetical protein